MYVTASDFDEEAVVATGTFGNCFDECSEEVERKFSHFPASAFKPQMIQRCYDNCFAEGAEALMNAQVATENVSTEDREKNTISLVNIGAGIILLIILIVISIRLLRK